MATLLADVDVLLRRHEALAPALDAAGDKLASDVREAIAAHAVALTRATASAKVSVGAHIVQQVNEVTLQAKADIAQAASRAQAESAAAFEALVANAVQRALQEQARVQRRANWFSVGWVFAVATMSAATASLMTAMALTL